MVMPNVAEAIRAVHEPHLVLWGVVHEVRSAVARRHPTAGVRTTGIRAGRRLRRPERRPRQRLPRLRPAWWRAQAAHVWRHARPAWRTRRHACVDAQSWMSQG